MSKENYRGIRWIQSEQKYKADVSENKVKYPCGFYLTAKEAALARDKMIIQKNLKTPLQVLKKIKK
jgi:hypothetical protein